MCIVKKGINLRKGAQVSLAERSNGMMDDFLDALSYTLSSRREKKGQNMKAV